MNPENDGPDWSIAMPGLSHAQAKHLKRLAKRTRAGEVMSVSDAIFGRDHFLDIATVEALQRVLN